MLRVARRTGIGSARLDTLVAIVALALPFVLPVLIVAWMRPALVATTGPIATASVALDDRQTTTPMATAASSEVAGPVRTPDASTPTPLAASTPVSTPGPTLGPSVTQPPTATVAEPADPAIDDFVPAGFLLIGGLAVVLLAVGSRESDRIEKRPRVT